MSKRQEYIRQLEQTLAKFLQPLKGIPFPIAIKAIRDCKVLSFDPSLRENKKLLNPLCKAAQIAGERAFQEGIFTARPNEAGNHIEPFVIDALREVGLKADKPVSRSGRKKAAGYPDIEIEDQNGRIIYMDCKTYNVKTREQNFRTFYFSPSDDPKITKDAFHLLMSFQLNTAKRKNKRAFVPISWEIYTLDKLLVQVKHEFNASNRELYTSEALLARGKISK